MIRKILGHKIWAILSALIVLLILVIISTGLGNLHFQAGRPIGNMEINNFQVVVAKALQVIVNTPIWKQAIFLVLVLLLMIIFVAIFPPEWRKRILMYYLRFALFILAMFFIVKNFHSLFPAIMVGKPSTIKGGPSVVDNLPSMFQPPKIQSILLYLISIGVIFSLSFIGYLIFQKWLPQLRSHSSPKPFKELASIARSSLEDISSGSNWEDVIIKCYAQMIEIVSIRKGLRRLKNVTASEFAGQLEEAGLPAESVRRLTHLFEMVRYGAIRPSNKERIEAIDSLTLIIQVCEAAQ